jgi:hypothetical protein
VLFVTACVTGATGVAAPTISVMLLLPPFDIQTLPAWSTAMPVGELIAPPV